MRNNMYFIFIFFLLLSYILPVHLLPWTTFFSEFLAFFSLLFLIPIFFIKNKKILIPKVALPFLVVCFIPLLQYFITDQILFFTTVWTSSLYIFSFFISIVIGFSLSRETDSLFMSLCITFIIASFVSTLIAFFQWTGLFIGQSWMMSFTGNRPYGNIGQFNQLSTLLSLGVLSSIYCYERRFINYPSMIFFVGVALFGMALTQSRTGWLIIIFSFFIIWLNRDKMILKKSQIITLPILYLTFIVLLPFLTSLLGSFFNIVSVNSVADRLSSGYLRLDIWKQMYYALLKEPISGYGWNQTSIAQSKVIDIYQGYEWISSAHNIFLDILIWCGLPLGLLIGFYIIWFYKKLFLSVKSKNELIVILMISALGIHSLLEFPLYYSFFLLPLGLFIGIVLSKSDCGFLKLSKKYLFFIFLGSFPLSYAVFNQYSLITDNLVEAERVNMNESLEPITLPYKLVLFDQYDARARWIALNPYKKMSGEDWNLAKEMSSLYTIPYDLKKYAKILALNGQEEEAKRQLKILNYTYRRNVTYDELLKKESDQK
ncbi:PglL family O-oligosaccharyltransferase [Acinetobacter apis]|uniref:O-antigen ligase n=1 Tax=Acinetobacter apis TaxID=1229165 RepID=A0A217EHD8_9GAMM|nr:O-antigen ligase family protein [Acinetobacter apis]SNQ29774.1 O-antigen ligase [Acinetobacter apis]